MVTDIGPFGLLGTQQQFLNIAIRLIKILKYYINNPKITLTLIMRNLISLLWF